MVVAQKARMLIGRCAWHRQYFGYPLWRGIASWRGWRIRFTDGICKECQRRFRDEARIYLEQSPPRRPANRIA